MRILSGFLGAKERQELKEIMETLKKNPFLFRALHKPFEGKRAAGLAEGRYRLVYSVELNTRRVFLFYVRARSRVYH